MDTVELIRQAASESAARTRSADEEALLAAQAFTYGVFDEYVEAQVSKVERAIDEQLGNSGTPAIVD